MHSFVRPLFAEAKVKITQTARAVTPFGRLVSFIAFLGQIGYSAQIEKHLPWQLTSPNAIPLAHTLTAFVAGVVVGARRFAHTEMARADRALLHALLGLERFPGADTVRGLFHRFTQAHIEAFWRPLWRWLLGLVRCPAGGLSLDLDSTVFQRSGQQAGAARGYNPRRPGRKSHHPLWRCWRRFLWCSTAGCAVATPVRRAGRWLSWPRRWPVARRVVGAVCASRQRVLRGGAAGGSGRTPTVLCGGGATDDDAQAAAGRDPGLAGGGRKLRGGRVHRSAPGLVKRAALRRGARAGPRGERRRRSQTARCARLHVPGLGDQPSGKSAGVVARLQWAACVEQRIEELKNDLAADGFCTQDFWATEAAFLAVLFTFNLLGLYQQQTAPEAQHRQPATLRTGVFLCGAILGRAGRQVVLHLSAAWGGLDKHKPLLDAVLHWRDQTSPKLLPPEDPVGAAASRI